MKDPRVAKLAEILIGHSTRVQPGEKVLVEAYDAPEDVVTALSRAALPRPAACRS